ncbi:hypothetical protein JHK85_034149 [Glycine max]|nr:hypothetical protein JHK85_034149 [Glycine max]
MDNKSLKCSQKLQLGSTPSQHNYFKCFCDRKEHVTPFSQEFSTLQEDDSPWERGNVLSNLALYVFTLHIPFSFGGLSVVALFNGQPVVDPQTEALSLLTIQILELSGALLLLKYTAKPQYKFSNFFKKNKLLSNRNWILSWALGFGFLVLLIFLTYLLADRLFDSQAKVDGRTTVKSVRFARRRRLRGMNLELCEIYRRLGPVNNPILKEMLLNSDISRVSCVLAYCIVTPLLEERCGSGDDNSDGNSGGVNGDDNDDRDGIMVNCAIAMTVMTLAPIDVHSLTPHSATPPALLITRTFSILRQQQEYEEMLVPHTDLAENNHQPMEEHWPHGDVGLVITGRSPVDYSKPLGEQMKDRAKELKVLLKKGVKIVGDSCKKGWNKISEYMSN